MDICTLSGFYPGLGNQWINWTISGYSTWISAHCLSFILTWTRQEVLPSRNSSSLAIRTSFLAGGREGELDRKLVPILKMLLFLPGNTSSLVAGAGGPPVQCSRHAIREGETKGCTYAKFKWEIKIHIYIRKNVYTRAFTCVVESVLGHWHLRQVVMYDYEEKRSSVGTESPRSESAPK